MILGELEAKSLLKGAAMPVVPVDIVSSAEDAKMRAVEMGYPVVLKLSSARFTHKTEIGGVILDIDSPGALEGAFGAMDELRDRLDPSASVIIEPMAPMGIEFFIGFQRDPGFGPVMSAGLGGIWLELHEDIAFRLLPASRGELAGMLSELRSWPKLVRGFRHLPPAGDGPLLDLMESVAAFALARPEISEMDLNPVMVYPDHAVIADARIVTG